MPLLSTLKYSTAKSAGASAGAGGVSLSAFSNSVEEGNEVTFIVSKAESGIDVPYTITGITADDLFFGDLTGNFTIGPQGQGQLTFILSETDVDYVDEIMTMTLDGTEVYIDVTIVNNTPTSVGESLYDTPGTYSWTCPDGVTSVCAVAIGGGGGSDSRAWTITGGGGGGLGYRNNISVTPGQTYEVIVGSGGISVDTSNVPGTGSSFVSSSIVSGGGGAGGKTVYTNAGQTGGAGGIFIGDGGGAGGTAIAIAAAYGSGTTSGGGSGAGGYGATGGQGGGRTAGPTAGTSSSNGGGGGGGAINVGAAGDGGGASLYGTSTTGTNASLGGTTGVGGYSGWDTRYAKLSEWPLDGGYKDTQGNVLHRYSKYGGGAGAQYQTGATIQRRGSHGAVRIMWGTGRSFPSNANYVAPSSGVSIVNERILNNPNDYGTAGSDLFGTSVAISGNYAIVGANGEDDVDGVNQANGRAYIFNVTTGALLHTLTNPNSYGVSQPDQFGTEVAIDGNYVIVSAPFEGDASGTESGAVYIFNVITGALLHTLNNPNAYGTPAGDSFGYAIGISGNYVIAGARFEDDAGGTQSGAAYIFNVSTGALVHTLLNPNGYGASAGDNFGSSVSISGNYAIVGAPVDEDAGGVASGKAYIFDVSTGELFRTLTNRNSFGTSAGDWYGWSVGISGNYAIVGAPFEDAGTTTYLLGSGAVYVYEVDTGTIVRIFSNPNSYGNRQNDFFGWEVAISGRYAIVSTPEEDYSPYYSQSGVAYFYTIPFGPTTTIADPNAYGTPAGDEYGGSCAVSGNYALVGAPLEDSAQGSSSGVVYIYKLSQT